MMKTASVKAFVALPLFSVLLSTLSFHIASAQNFKGKDGSENYSSAGTYILNRYTSLAAAASSASFTINVADINQLKGSYTFTNAVNPYTTDALSKGDMVMIIQMQGADVTTLNNSGYGAITNYNNTGNYELKTVFDVSGNTIYFCEGLKNNYSQSGTRRTQVVRIPRLTSLTVGSTAVITGAAWNGVTGGVVAFDVSGNITINGEISATAIGFRGGVDDITVSISSGTYTNTAYVSTNATKYDASKGESIAGNSTDYEGMTGSCGRGAVANGGGGGNGHNAGGGGGSNAGTNGVLAPWNGTGLKDISTASWAAAWDLEYSGFSTDVSTGGGRGGYTYSSSNQDALVYGPNNSIWGGNQRMNVGGFGGRPLDYNSNTRLFFGGGGGAGEGNNSSAGDGGNGGGIVYLLCNGNISGSGIIRANGQNGFSTKNSFIDAAGGAGGGGAVVALANGSISGITIQANGGNGGDQNYLTGEAEGPGGGGGGGYIATSATSVIRQVNGGNNGISYSTHVTEFLPNGATKGASGTIASRTFTDVFSCNESGFLLPVTFISFTAEKRNGVVTLNWLVENEAGIAGYEVERSVSATGGFSSVNQITANNSLRAGYSSRDDVSGIISGSVFYRVKSVGADGKTGYSKVIQVQLGNKESGFSVWPNVLKVGQQLTIKKGQGTGDGNYGYTIMRSSGQVVTKKQFSGDCHIIFDPGIYPKGIYIVAISGEQTYQAFRVILQ